jgi:hypothetical protein
MALATLKGGGRVMTCLIENQQLVFPTYLLWFLDFRTRLSAERAPFQKQYLEVVQAKRVHQLDYDGSEYDTQPVCTACGAQAMHTSG